MFVCLKEKTLRFFLVRFFFVPIVPKGKRIERRPDQLLPLPAPPPSPPSNSSLLFAAEAPAALPEGGDSEPSSELPPVPFPPPLFEDDEEEERGCALRRGEPRKASS